MTKKEIKKIQNIITKNVRTLEAFNKVKQTGIGYKIKDGKIMRDTIAAIFFVRYKPGMRMLRSLNIEPLPKEIEGIPTDVIEVPTGFDIRILRLSPGLVAPDDSKYRPVSGGTAMINSNAFPLGTGTLGLIVQRRASNELFACTNNHVGANEDVEGLPSTAYVGDPWIQPGAHGSGQHPDDTIGILDNWNKMKPVGSGINYYDFSIGKVNEPANSYEVMEIGTVEKSADAELGDRVLKRGRTTRKTLGEIIIVNVNHRVPYQGIGCIFSDQVIIVGVPETIPFSSLGDSGSFVVSEESPHKVKGQLFSGAVNSDGIDLTVASPIRKIIDDFNLDL